MKKTKDKGIIFSAPMVRAILAGKKTATRRVVKDQPPSQEAVQKLCGSDHYTWSPIVQDGRVFFPIGDVWAVRKAWACGMLHRKMDAEIYAPWTKGDRLWVREKWRAEEDPQTMIDGIHFAADDAFVPIHNTAAAADRWGAAYDNGKHQGQGKWRSPLFLPRWASRITLEATAVRLDTLHALTEEDALAEGFGAWTTRGAGIIPARTQYSELWEKLHGKKHPWDTNPWVWVLEFKVVDTVARNLATAAKQIHRATTPETTK